MLELRKGERLKAKLARTGSLSKSHIPDCSLPEKITKGQFVPFVERVVGHEQVLRNFETAVSAGVREAMLPAVIARSAVRAQVQCLDLLAPLNSGESWSQVIGDLANLAVATNVDFASEHNI